MKRPRVAWQVLAVGSFLYEQLYKSLKLSLVDEDKINYVAIDTSDLEKWLQFLISL